MTDLKSKWRFAMYACFLCILLLAVTGLDTNQSVQVIGDSITSTKHSPANIIQKAEPANLHTLAQLGLGTILPCEALFDPPRGFWLAPSKWTGHLYGPSILNANWHFTQWKNPESDYPSLNSEKAATPSGRLVDLGGCWEIAQNGENLPPGDEFASFAAANRSDVYPGHPPAGKRSRPLSQMQSLHHSIGFMSKYENVVGDQELNRGGFLTALVLKNIDNGDKFYYQLELRPVNKPPSRHWWTWSGPRWGYGDTILSYGSAIPPVGKRVFYHWDLLPRVTEILENAFNGCDTDLSHWVVVGTYHGSHIWGNVRVTGVWDSFSLHAEYKAY